MIDDDFVKSLLEKCSYLSLRHQEDCLTLDCPADSVIAFSRHLRDEETFDLLVDLTAVDHGETADIRFSVVLHFYSLIHRTYLRVHIACAENEAPEIPSISSVFPAANWHERETFDMFGIKFANHPNLKRILMWDEYPYFPLQGISPCRDRCTFTCGRCCGSDRGGCGPCSNDGRPLCFLRQRQNE